MENPKQTDLQHLQPISTPTFRKMDVINFLVDLINGAMDLIIGTISEYLIKTFLTQSMQKMNETLTRPTSE